MRKAIFPVISFFLVFYSLSAQDAFDQRERYLNFFRGKLSLDSLLVYSDPSRSEANTRTLLLKDSALFHISASRDYNKALEMLFDALVLEDSLGQKEQQIITYLAISKVFEEVGDYHKGAGFLEQALVLNEKLKNVEVDILILNKLGQLNAQLGKLEEASDNYEHVLNLNEYYGDGAIEAEAIYNQSHVFQKQGRLDEALASHLKALGIRRSIHDRIGEATSLNDIGELCEQMQNQERAFANHFAALEIRRLIGDKKGLAESYNNIGIYYYKRKNYERAVANFKLVEQPARELQLQDELRECFDYLSLCYKELGNHERALHYRDDYMAITELIESERNQRQLWENEARHVLSQKESQIQNLETIREKRESELEAQKQFRNFLMALIALSVIIVLLVLTLYVLKRRSNKELRVANEKVRQQNIELQDLNATKDKFFSIISHDLKGPLNSLTSFSGLLINHTESLSKEDIQMLAKDLDKSVKNLFALLENLLEWSRSQTGNIEFTPEAFDLALLLQENKELLTAQAQHKGIAITNETQGKIVIRAHKHSVNTVIRNLISNAIKFTPENGSIRLNLQQINKNVVVSVADTGVGMSADIIAKLFRIDTKHSTKGTANEKGTGLGLILCKEFIEKNGGRIWVESEQGKGSVFYFSLPHSNITRQVMELAH